VSLLLFEMARGHQNDGAKSATGKYGTIAPGTFLGLNRPEGIQKIPVHIYTLNVGQGQFVVVVGQSQAVIVDTFVPLNPTQEIIHVKAALAHILANRALVGLMITGFDADHFNVVGLNIILNKYRPNWLMYPSYRKESANASECFREISKYSAKTQILKVPVNLSDTDKRFYSQLSSEFDFEVFSPHGEDMTSSNNSSLVCKIREYGTGARYLVTGDTEGARWDSIVRFFGGSLKVDVLAAPHHGSANGITEQALRHIAPHTTLISAGVNNPYGHPAASAVRLFQSYSTKLFQTNVGRGQSIETVVSAAGVTNHLFRC